MRTQSLNFLFSTFKYNQRKDYYKVLEVCNTATVKQIKSAYIRLAKKHHPDMNKGKQSQLFKEINQANRILSDEKLKTQYDAAFKYEKSQQSQAKTQKTQSSGYNAYYENYWAKTKYQKEQQYKTYQYPDNFRDWFKSEKKEKYKNPKQTFKKDQDNQSVFSSNSKYDEKLKMHYEMGKAFERKEREEEMKKAPTLDQEIERLKSTMFEKAKFYSNSVLGKIGIKK